MHAAMQGLHGHLQRGSLPLHGVPLSSGGRQRGLRLLQQLRRRGVPRCRLLQRSLHNCGVS